MKPGNEKRRLVVWLTGLSGSGKTSIADALCAMLDEKGVPNEHLDGDKIREFFPATGFSRTERIAHAKRAGYLAGFLEKHGIVVVASLITPYEEARKAASRMCQNYFEVYVDTPIETCEARDPKGLYAKARRGEIKQFTGVDDPYEAPSKPHLKVSGAKGKPQDAAKEILNAIGKFL